MHLERSDRGDDHRRFRLQPAHSTLDIEELFDTQIRAEARLGDDDVGKGERRARSETAVAPVRDVAEWSRVNEGRPALERLDDVRTDRVLEEQRHRAGRAQLARRDRALRRTVGRSNDY